MHFQERGIPLKLELVRQYFPCRHCGARDCLIVPATATGARPKDDVSFGVTWFFAGRSAAKGHSPKAALAREFELKGARIVPLINWRAVRRWSPPAGRLQIVPDKRKYVK